MSKLSLRPTYKGYIIPYIVMVKDTIPLFKVNDDNLVEECIEKKLCSVCGGELHDDMWMLGGPQSAFNPRGAYFDIPVHKECGEYSLKTCPYLASSTYSHNSSIQHLQKRVGDNVKLVDPTIDPNRVPFFVLAKTSGYNVIRRIGSRIIVPVKPFLEIEIWNDSLKLDQDTAKLEVEKLGYSL